MAIRRLLTLATFVVLVLELTGCSSEPPVRYEGTIDIESAAAYFAEAAQASEHDDGGLWGIPLGGPMLFVDPISRTVVANQADAEGRLAPHSKLWVGQMAPEFNVANFAVEWSGTVWTMLLWPSLSDDPAARTTLMMHESWHRVQDDIGFPAVSSENQHLDTEEGRALLRLEWRALRHALTSVDTDSRKAAEDALVFRALRHQRFDGAAERESRFEMHEGLAEYTGLALCGLSASDAAALLADRLEDSARGKSVVLSFAYQSGPAYALLLDAFGATWREGLQPTDDLSSILRSHLDVEQPQDLHSAAEVRYASYDAEPVFAEERERAHQAEMTRLHYSRRFVEVPVLVLPNRNMNIMFNPNEGTVTLGDHGVVHPSLRVTADWGVLEAREGALRDHGWMWVKVPSPAEPGGTSVSGNGWTLVLTDGWTLTSHEEGFTVTENE